MERTFSHNSSENPVSWSSVPPGGAEWNKGESGEGTKEDKDRDSNDYFSPNSAGVATSQELRDGESATVIGVLSESKTLDRLPDAQLMVAVEEGNCAALETLYDRHVRICFGLALRLVRDPSVAEDITHDVFLKIWSRPQAFLPQRGKFVPWLLTIVHHRSIDKLRTMRGGTGGKTSPPGLARNAGGVPCVDIVDTIPDASPSPYESAWTNETGRLVQGALSQLPARQQEVIVLAYFEGLTQSEIATKLHRPLGTVKTHTRSALHTLRELFNSQGLLNME